MKLTQHSTNNAVFGAPPGVSAEQCKPAPATKMSYENGQRSIRTYWRPSADELTLLNTKGVVCVETWGTTLVPMNVMACEQDEARKNRETWDDGRVQDWGA